MTKPLKRAIAMGVEGFCNLLIRLQFKSGFKLAIIAIVEQLQGYEGLKIDYNYL